MIRPVQPAGSYGDDPTIIPFPVPRPTVLLAEDDAELRSIFRTALERDGFFVLESEDGADALEVVKGRGDRIHLLISDAVMPTIGGRELLWHVKAMHPALPIIMVSGLLSEQAAYADIDLRADLFLQKPIQPSDLVTSARSLLRL